jgi:hypothetical protein
MLGVGLLVNDNKSQRCIGTKMQAYYKRKLNEHISLQVGGSTLETLQTF